MTAQRSAAPAPLYTPFPHYYRDVQWCAAVCEVPEEDVVPFIPEPLVPVGEGIDRIEVFVAHYADTEYGVYREAGLLVPARYGDLAGQSFVALYLDNPRAIACGREMIGSPKKEAEVTFRREGETVTGRCTRDGVELIALDARLDDATEVTRLPLGPRLLVREVMRPDGGGVELRQVMRKDFDPSFFTIHERRTGTATLRLGGTPDDPLQRLRIQCVLGAAYSRSDFSLEPCTVLDTWYHPRPNAQAIREPALARR